METSFKKITSLNKMLDNKLQFDNESDSYEVAQYDFNTRRTASIVAVAAPL